MTNALNVKDLRDMKLKHEAETKHFNQDIARIEAKIKDIVFEIINKRIADGICDDIKLVSLHMYKASAVDDDFAHIDVNSVVHGLMQRDELLTTKRECKLVSFINLYNVVMQALNDYKQTSDLKIDIKNIDGVSCNWVSMTIDLNIPDTGVSNSDIF